jgi:hypothetical protein
MCGFNTSRFGRLGADWSVENMNPCVTFVMYLHDLWFVGKV